MCALVREKPDLIITDLRMPIVDGFSLITELRTHRDTRDIPIFVVSGLDSPEARETAMEAGCNGYFTKPLNPDIFATQIKDFLSSSRKKPAVKRARSTTRPSRKKRR